jgi:hypothetical protein
LGAPPASTVDHEIMRNHNLGLTLTHNSNK